jgi:hypothetical protein
MLEPEKVHEQLDSAGESPEEDLPAVAVFEIDVQGTRGRRYKGRFIYKVPSIGDQIKIGQMKSIYLPSGAAADQNAMLLVEQMCYLEITLQKPRPDWYQPLSMYDAAAMSELYRRALDYERKFHRADAERPTDQGIDNSAEGSTEDSAPAVGRKVQPPAQRRETLVDHTEGGT